ncbi:MAG: methyltransferase domain-containing protein [Imperialibacter sp.]|uniref:class I SAM-dependent methyltransferase n=1 Tax=Imperialibacter sp. TaxID=2038411 RepID=UPI0032EED0E8
MKYLNLGCGHSYVNNKDWVNIDFVKTGSNVIAHNLLKGIPYKDSSFDFVYHSHVLEHFSKLDGRRFLEECFRVLKKDGIIRIAIPDLEQIATKYLELLHLGLKAPSDEKIRQNYEWMMLEMYDQTVRNHPGGLMGKYLQREELSNQDFVYSRIGFEGKNYRDSYFSTKKMKSDISAKKLVGKIARGIAKRVINFNPLNISRYHKIGKFRLQGEIHQWMYDRYSLTSLLTELGFTNIVVRDAYTSSIEGWSVFQLDSLDEAVKKPDSLYIEAKKTS